MKKIKFTLIVLVMSGCIQKQIKNTYGPFDCDNGKKLRIQESYQYNQIEGVNTEYNVSFTFDQKLIAKNIPRFYNFDTKDIEASYFSIDLSENTSFAAKLLEAVDVVAVNNDKKEANELALCLMKNQAPLYAQFPKEASIRFNRVVILKPGTKLIEAPTTEL